MVSSVIADWTPIDWKTLPKAAPADEVELLYLNAPLLEGQYGKFLEDFDLYHAAIAFVNKNTSMMITLNYDSDNFLADMFPEIITEKNGSQTLIWSNYGAAFVYMGVNSTYWTTILPLAILSGSQYNSFMANWNSKINSTNEYYNMFSIMSGNGTLVFVPSWNCFDYVWTAFDYLYGIGVRFDPENKPYYLYSMMRSSDPPVDITQLYYANATVHQSVNQFFEIILGAFQNTSILQVVAELLVEYDGTFFIHSSDKLLELVMGWPFISWDWLPRNLPGMTGELEPVQPSKEISVKFLKFWREVNLRK